MFFVSRLGSDAVAAIGLTEALLTIVYTAAIGLSIGVAAVVARRIGEKDFSGAAESSVRALILGLFAAVAAGTVGILHAPSLLRVMGASPSVLASGSGFARIMLGGGGTVLLLFLINAIFRGP